MFDDHNTNNQPGVPGNLPVGEPEDMFSGVDKVSASAEPISPQPVADAPTESVPQAGTALGAGVLKPKQEQVPEVSQPTVVTNPQPVNPAPIPDQDTYTLKEPSVSKSLILIVGIVIAIIVLGGGGWLIFAKFARSDAKLQPQAPVAPFTPTQITQPVVDNAEDNALGNDSLDSVVPSNGGELDNKVIDNSLLFGASLDKDADGLDDLDEAKQGTDPNHWDSDGDGLSDGEEVVIWGTEPLNPDTDNDGYEDGEEIKAGYNPKGVGKLFEPPTEEDINNAS